MASSTQLGRHAGQLIVVQPEHLQVGELAQFGRHAGQVIVVQPEVLQVGELAQFGRYAGQLIVGQTEDLQVERAGPVRAARPSVALLSDEPIEDVAGWRD